MTAIAFNPSRSVVFDLAQGSVRITPGHASAVGANATGERGNPQVLLSTEVFQELVRAHPDPRPLGRAIGSEIAERASQRQPSRAALPSESGDPSFRSLTVAEVADLLGGELALVGFGNLRVERWGAALLFVLDPCPLDKHADRFLEGVIEGAVTRAGTSPRARPITTIHARVVDRDSETIRIFIGNETAAVRAAEMHEDGAVFTDIVAALQERDG